MRGRVAAAGLVAVLLAGCAGAQPPVPPPAPTGASSPIPASPSTSAPAPTPTPTPSATPTATPTVTTAWEPKGKWKLVLDSDFGGDRLPKQWDHRLTDVYDAGGRWCSAPRKANLSLTGDSVRLTMSRASKATARKVEPTAERKQRRAGEKVVGCPDGVYDNAMISTEGRFSIQSGVVAARVKFPIEQGAHAAVWLQSRQGQELDLIESYGFGRGISNVVHLKGRKIPKEGRDSWVADETVADRQWWSQWHIVSLEWNRDRIVFRLDGEVTRELKVRTARADYFLVLSLLSSDWETYRIAEPGARPPSGVDPAEVVKPELPFSMEVDWVRAWKKA